MKQMNLSFRVVNQEQEQDQITSIEQCYDRLKLVTEFAENYGMPTVKLKLIDDYIEISFKTDLIAKIYVQVLKDLLHIVQSYELSDCCYQISPILKRKD